jgi:hypothetical protein
VREIGPSATLLSYKPSSFVSDRRDNRGDQKAFVRRIARLLVEFLVGLDEASE